MMDRIKRVYGRVYGVVYDRPVVFTLTSMAALALAGALIYFLRYPFAFTDSNFYAEDGKVFVARIWERGPLFGALSPFNGYLIIGQYFVVLGAFLINGVFGHGFITLAASVALASYAFWGILCAIPWLLFRRRLGVFASLLLVGALWLTPLGSYDYSLIGTIGNLKFAFFFIAVLLVLFRIDPKSCDSQYKAIAADAGLLLCILTNIVSLGLLPVLAWHHRSDIRRLLTDRREPSREFVSFVVLGVISVLYVAAVYFHGIPKNPGYLDSPLMRHTLTDILFRGSLYGIFYPIIGLLSTVSAIFLMILFGCMAAVSRHRRLFAILAYALVINVAGFVFNRTGVTGFFAAFNDHVGAGQFFYAGTMLTVFGLFYALAPRFRRLRIRGVLFTAATAVLTFVIIFPAAGYTHSDPYAGVRPNLATQVVRECAKEPRPKTSLIEFYPMSGWSMDIARSRLCSR